MKRIGNELSKKILMLARSIYAVNGKLVVIVSIIALVFFFGCSDDAPRDKAPHSLKAGNISSDNNMRIVIHWPGDDFAGKKDLETRGQIEGLILERKVGKIIRAGTGMGWMDLWIEVKDKAVAKPEVKEIIETVAPTVKYSIE